MKAFRFAESYVKAYRLRIKKNSAFEILKEEINNMIDLFLEDRNNPIINDPELTGRLYGKRAFSITSDIRIIYIETDDEFVFLDIGTHEQVYQ